MVGVHGVHSFLLLYLRRVLLLCFCDLSAWQAYIRYLINSKGLLPPGRWDQMLQDAAKKWLLTT